MPLLPFVRRHAPLGVLLLALSTSRGSAQPTAAAVAWQPAPALETPRDHHAVFALETAGGRYLYVAGGTDYQRMFGDAARAPIRGDGSLGPWEASTPLPSPRAGMSVVLANGTAVLTGGQVATGEGMRGLRRIAEVYTARVDDRGRLGAWRASAPLPAPRFHHPVVEHGGWVYVVGGQGEREAEAGVFRGRLDEEGAIREWREMTALPRPRSHHAAVVIDGHVYVFGGLDGAPGRHQAAFTDVLRAPIRADGTLGEWQTVSLLPHPYATHSAFLHGGRVWLLGGVEDLQRFTDAVWRAPVHATGALGPWEPATPGLPVARGHVHVTPVVDGRVYTAGGRIATEDGRPAVTGSVHVGTLPSPVLHTGGAAPEDAARR